MINLNRVVTVQRQSVTLVNGAESVSWVPLAYQVGSPADAVRFAAEVQDVMPSRSEAVRYGLTVARNQTRVRMRWRNDIDSSMRIVVHGGGDRVLQIIGGPAEIGGLKRYIEMMCEDVSS